MPCDTIQTTSVALTVGNTALLVEGLKAAGYNVQQYAEGGDVTFARGRDGVRGTFRDGTLSVSQYRAAAASDIINEIKRAHSVANVRSTARQFGWQLSETDATHFVATKRGM